MRLTARDKSNLRRFGCTFAPKEKRFYVEWRSPRIELVATAKIIVRLTHTQAPASPIALLAFEISPTKAIPFYCYFPFNLSDSADREYLAHVCSHGSIELAFMIEARNIRRTIQISNNQRLRMTKLLDTAILEYQKFPFSDYNFEGTVDEFEQKIRIVELFSYAVTEDELNEAVKMVTAQAETLKGENQAEAQQIATEFFEVLRSRYDILGPAIEQIPIYIKTFQRLSDLHKCFDGNYEGALQLAKNLIAVHPNEKDNEQLRFLVLLLKAVFHLIPATTTTTPDQVVSSDEKPNIGGILNDVVSGRGLPLAALGNVLSDIGIQVGGKPGRRPADYAEEYALRHTNKTWREVTEWSLANNPEIRQEFGGKKFSELTFEQQEQLKHRIRAGVRSQAKRHNKELPS